MFIFTMSEFKNTTYLIIGGGIAGTTAAQTIRKNDEQGKIILISKEPYPLYSRILISKPEFFFQKIPFDRIWLKNLNWYKEKKIDFLCGREVVFLNSEKQMVRLDNGEQIFFEKCIIATGGRPKTWNVLGSEKKGIYQLHTLDQAKHIIQDFPSKKQAVVIGGGFVGFEICSLLSQTSVQTTLIVRRKHFWSSLFEVPVSRIVERHMQTAGVKIIYEANVQSVEGEQHVESLLLENGERIFTDAVFVGIGMDYDLDWVRQAGIQTNNGILADAFLQTNKKAIWVAGDIAEFEDVILGERGQYENWSNAQKQGQYVGQAVVEKVQEPFRFVSSCTTSGFGLQMVFMGKIQKQKDLEIFCYEQENGNRLYQFVFQKTCLVGAIILNASEEMGEIKRLIECRAKELEVKNFLNHKTRLF